MRILLIGDSITNGRLGSSFADRIQASDPTLHLQNLGKDGETLNRIIHRLLQHLRKDNRFDVVVLQGGYNDLLLPTFPDKGPLFRFAYRQQRKQGNHPLPADDREAVAVLTNAIKDIRQLYQGKIILLTLGCLGEDLQSALNQQRRWLNGILETVAEKENLALTSTHEMVDRFLQNKLPSPYCLDSFWAVTLLDRITHRWIAKRKLHLTIDGVHLNPAGADIFARSVLDTLQRQDDPYAASLQHLD